MASFPVRDQKQTRRGLTVNGEEPEEEDSDWIPVSSQGNPESNLKEPESIWVDGNSAEDADGGLEDPEPAAG